VYDAVSLALLNELKVQDLVRQRPAVRPPTDAAPSPSPAAAGLTAIYALPRLVAQAVTLLLAVRIQIVIAR
jgi:hypothetical protein